MKLDTKDLTILAINLAIVVVGVTIAQKWVVPMLNTVTVPPATA